MERSETVRRLKMAKEILLLPEIPGVDRFDMSVWGEAESLGEDGNYCGTVCCFGGALGLQPEFRELGFIAEWRKVTLSFGGGTTYVLDAQYADGTWREFGNMAAEVFGITEFEAGELFWDGLSALDPDELFWDGSEEDDFSKEFVARRVDVLIRRYSMPRAA